MGKLLPAAGARLLCKTMMSHNEVTSSRHSARLPPEGGFKLHSGRSETLACGNTVCPCLLCFSSESRVERVNYPLQSIVLLDAIIIIGLNNSYGFEKGFGTRSCLNKYKSMKEQD